MPSSLHNTLLPLMAAILFATTGAVAAEEPPLLPLSAFFANPGASWDYRVSPDGTRLAWIAMHEGQASLHFRRLDETVARVVKTPRYELHSNEFRRAAEVILQKAQAKNIDGVAYGYMDLTMTCVRCHQYVREVRDARLPLNPPVLAQASK